MWLACCSAERAGVRPSGNGCDGVTTNASGIVMLLMLIAFPGPSPGPNPSWSMTGSVVAAAPSAPILVSGGAVPVAATRLEGLPLGGGFDILVPCGSHSPS
ncbi:hypothetical protein SCMU_07960 [Sinomonas cyclohexanicum]|uniref:Secreted protein n=1 Tax=Sinomonas cyclohexanicum TaxID=322009 RepID=A0ABM7PRX2_SINCY|nr:hypothetical protein SCMU_07960 [Corynebacterium cyclohexanicum]